MKVASIVRAKLEANRTQTKIQSQKINRELSMARYKLDVPMGRLNSVFGSAYPTRSLKNSQKATFIERAIAALMDISISNYDGRTDGKCVRVAIQDKSCYEIEILTPRDTPEREGYELAQRVEEWVVSRPRNPHHSIKTLIRRVTRRGSPTDSYLVSDLDLGKVLLWLDENAKTSDYQLYSKYGTDYSLGFCNAELSTMFKLTFGDRQNE